MINDEKNIVNVGSTVIWYSVMCLLSVFHWSLLSPDFIINSFFMNLKVIFRYI